MDNFQEMSDVMRRASLISLTKPVELMDKLNNDANKPKDTFYLVHVLSLLFGVLHMLPLTFFVTANDYWMYKFRDVSKGIVDLNNKTTLETYFVSGSMVVQTAPSIVTMVLSAVYGPRFNIHLRLIISLCSINVIFIIFTVFIKVDTDTWQVGFFVLVLLGMSFITAFLNLFQITSIVVISKFPTAYMKTFLFGEGVATIFNASLQVISLGLGTSTETSALFYFISGTLVIFSTFSLYLLIRSTTFYKYYMQIELEDAKKKYSKEEIKATFFQIWPCLAMMIIVILTIDLTHPSVTSLIVSENYGNGNRWNDVFFVPTTTFLFTEICSQFGRLVSTAIITKTNGPWMVGLTVVRMAILVPLVWFTNAQPRNNLPVLLPHDWQYILICVLYFLTSGYLFNAMTLSISKLAKENEDIGYLLLMTCVGVFSGLLSPISLLAVRIL